MGQESPAIYLPFLLPRGRPRFSECLKAATVETSVAATAEILHVDRTTLEARVGKKLGAQGRAVARDHGPVPRWSGAAPRARARPVRRVDDAHRGRRHGGRPLRAR